MDLEKEFEVKSKLERLISVTKDYWRVITEIKHPVINGSGFLITAYFTDRIKEGDIKWTK